MSKWHKAAAKILSGDSDNNFTFAEADYVLKKFGFEQLPNNGSSHFTYRHPVTKKKITIVTHGKSIKPIYVKTIRKILQA